MELYPNRILPKDVFITTLNADEQKEQSNIDTPTEKNKLSGNDFIDGLANLLANYKMPTMYFCAGKLGLSMDSMRQLMFFYTGKNFLDWRSEYCLLCAKELLLVTNGTLGEVGKRLGFADASSFGRWFVGLQKKAPSIWRKEAKEAHLAKEKQLFEEWKKTINKSTFE